MDYSFTPDSLKDLKKLNKPTQQKIVSKLDYYTNLPNPLTHANHLINHKIGQYRFRIGDYRVIFDIADDILLVLAFGHRREIYK